VDEAPRAKAIGSLPEDSRRTFALPCLPKSKVPTSLLLLISENEAD